MKKILSTTIISAISIMLITACSSKEPTMGAHIDKTDESTIKTAIYIGNMKTEKAILAVEKAAEKNGWKVTEFKRNAVIVEKVIGDKTINRTIKVHNKHISGDKQASGYELSNLREAIVEEVKNENNPHH